MAREQPVAQESSTLDRGPTDKNDRCLNIARRDVQCILNNTQFRVSTLEIYDDSGAMDRVRHVCASVSCATAEKYDADRLCAGCRSVFYCSPECQRDDWKGHKPACRVATAEREASQMVRVGKGGGSSPAAAAAPERVGHPASQWVAGAARGEAEALYHLGCCYYRGEGVPQSYERAAELWKQAAAKGDASAQCNLGFLYHDGQGVPQSYERAAKLFQQAAAQGHAHAQTRLGALYLEGKGVPKDVARAVALLKQAAAGGDKPAADALQLLGEAVPPGAP